jgi:hypothetical protein
MRGLGGVPSVEPMTDVHVQTPPMLYLPPYPLAQAEGCIDEARRALRNARKVEWVSAAADGYRAELATLGASVDALAAAIDHARERLASARWAAHASGQL